MYYCPDCGYEFEEPEKIYETHGFNTPPYEKLTVCPMCKATSFYEKVNTHCRCCGAKLKKGGKYCSASCQEKGERLWQKERIRRRIRQSDPLNEIIREIESYNKINKTDYSYGKYVAIVKSKEKAVKSKCVKKRKKS